MSTEVPDDPITWIIEHDVGGPRLTPRTLWDAIDLADIPQGSWYETVHPNERYL